jgi:hypothetical protein
MKTTGGLAPILCVVQAEQWMELLKSNLPQILTLQLLCYNHADGKVAKLDHHITPNLCLSIQTNISVHLITGFLLTCFQPRYGKCSLKYPLIKHIGEVIKEAWSYVAISNTNSKEERDIPLLIVFHWNVGMETKVAPGSCSSNPSSSSGVKEQSSWIYRFSILCRATGPAWSQPPRKIVSMKLAVNLCLW